MTFAFLLLIFLRILLGHFIGGEAFKRRLIVLGAGPRAERIRKLADRRGSGFSIVGYIAMNDGAKVIPEAIDRSAIYNLSDFVVRSEEHTSELQSLMRITYAVFCLKKKNKI